MIRRFKGTSGRAKRRHEEETGHGGGRSDLAAGIPHAVLAQTPQKPHSVVIWGDDIGTWNISHNSRGMMGYQTPNIDRVAREGVAFTDY